MNILDQIVETKRVALASKKKEIGLSELLSENRRMKNPDSLRKSINVKGELSIIAEMKRKSPSAGEIVKSYARPPSVRARSATISRTSEIMQGEKKSASASRGVERERYQLPSP